MDQQEYEPELQSPQQRQAQHENEIEAPAQPYYWSSKPNAPKDEPASLYDEPMLQSDETGSYMSGYVAREQRANTKQTPNAQQRFQIVAPASAQSRQRQQFSPDGDSFEAQYRPGAANQQQWRVPPWARPQVHRRSPGRTLMFLLICILCIVPLMHFLLIVLGAFLAVVGVIILALLVPFMLVILVGIPFALMRFGFGLGRMRHRPRRWRYTNYWRGPWGR